MKPRWLEAADRAPAAVLAAAPLGAALLVAPGLLDSPVDLPKRLMLEGLVAAGWLAWLVAGLVHGRLAWTRPATAVPALGLVLAWLAASAGAANLRMALDAAGGVALVVGLAGLAAALLPAGAESGVVNAALLAAGLEALYGILQYAGIEFLPWASSWGSRCFGTLGNPIFFAEFLAPLFVVGVARWLAEEDEERKDLYALLVLVLFLALLFAQTRSAWLGAAGGTAVLLGGLVRGVPGGRALLGRNRTWLLAFAGFAAAVVVTVSSPAVFGSGALPLRDRVRDLGNRGGWTVRHRLVLWRAAALAGREAPLLGAGPAHFGTRFPDLQAGFRAAEAARGFFFPPKEQRAHNDYLQDLAEVGVLGLGAWLWVLAATWRCGRAALSRSAGAADGALAAGMLGGCAALALDAAFNFPFRILPVAAVFWLLAGRLAARAGRGAVATLRADAGSEGRRSGMAVAAAAALLLLVGRRDATAVAADRAMARASAHLGANFYEMAEDAFTEVLRRRPGDALAHYLAGTALEKTWMYDWTGRTLDRALVHYETALRLGLHDELLYAHLALLYEKKGFLPGAIRYGEEAVRIYPEFGDHLSNLAYWVLQRGDRPERALDLATRAAELVPRHPLYRWTRGLALEALGRRREAAADLETAQRLLPNVSDGAGYAADLARDLARVRGVK